MNSVGLELRFCLLNDAFVMARGDGVVGAPGDQQQRTALRVAGVDLDLRARVEVRERRLEEGRPRSGHVERLVQVTGLLLGDGVGPAVAELGRR